MLDTKDGIYVIAEIASTHEGDFDYLIELIKCTAQTGANAIKFQIYRAAEIVEENHPGFAELNSYELSMDQWGTIIKTAFESGLDVWVDLSGEYGKRIVEDNLSMILGCKLHSSDISNSQHIEFINQTNLSVILSCGGTTVSEIIEALNQFSKDDRTIALMHGFQSYPTDLEDTHIDRIKTLSSYFPFPIGIADHLDGGNDFAPVLPVLAVGAGARIIEKHITIDREEKRDDYYSALNPETFSTMVSSLKCSKKALGSRFFDFSEKEMDYRMEMKKNVVLTKDISKGSKINLKEIELIRTSGRISKSSSGLYKSLSLPVKTHIKAGNIIIDSNLDHNIGIFVNARLHSTRLPGKALLPLYQEYSTIEYLLKRLKSYPTLPGTIVFATSTDPQDDPLMACAREIGVDAFRGSPLDVMKRMLQVSEHFNFDTLVRVTGDDIFVSAEYIEKGLEFHYQNNLEYTRMNGLGFGLECEIIDTRMLSQIHPHINNKQSTEYLTWFLELIVDRMIKFLIFNFNIFSFK